MAVSPPECASSVAASGECRRLGPAATWGGSASIRFNQCARAKWLRHSVSRLRRRGLCRPWPPCKVASVVDGTGAFSPQTALGCPCTAWMCTRAAQLLGPDSGAAPASGPELPAGSPVFRPEASHTPAKRPPKHAGHANRWTKSSGKCPQKASKTCGPHRKLVKINLDPDPNGRGRMCDRPRRGPFRVSGGPK